MTIGSLLSLLGLSFYIWGVLLVFNEWQLAALPEQAKAHVETIQFFRKLRGRFDDQDRAYHRETVLKREIALSRIMGDAYETSFRQDNRDAFMRKGKLLILIGFVLQFTGALPWTSISWREVALAAESLLVSRAGEAVLASVATAIILCLPLISDNFRVARKAKALDKTFTGVWWSPFNSNNDLLRMNILCDRGKIIGLINARELDDSGLQMIGDVPKYYQVRGAVEDGIAKLSIQEYAGTEPYAYAMADLTPDTSNLIWDLDPKHPDYIGWFRKREILERHNTF